MRTVYSHDKFVGMINKQHKCADGFRKEEPWLLLHNTGRTDRFGTLTQARDEAVKTWPAVTFRVEGATS